MLELKRMFSLGANPLDTAALHDFRQALVKWAIVKEIHQNISYGKDHLSLLGLPPLLPWVSTLLS